MQQCLPLGAKNILRLPYRPFRLKDITRRCWPEWAEEMKIDIFCDYFRIVVEERVITDSQLPEESMIMNLAAMENQLAMNGAPRRPDEKKFTEPPKFARQLLSQLGLKETERAKFETYVTPTNDPSLVIEWYKDGQPLKTGKLLHPSFFLKAIEMQEV